VILELNVPSYRADAAKRGKRSRTTGLTDEASKTLDGAIASAN